MAQKLAEVPGVTALPTPFSTWYSSVSTFPYLRMSWVKESWLLLSVATIEIKGGHFFQKQSRDPCVGQTEESRGQEEERRECCLWIFISSECTGCKRVQEVSDVLFFYFPAIGSRAPQLWACVARTLTLSSAPSPGCHRKQPGCPPYQHPCRQGWFKSQWDRVRASTIWWQLSLTLMAVRYFQILNQ